MTLWPGGVGERVETRGLQLQLAWGLRVLILMREDVLSLLLPFALSQCLWFLPVPLLLARHSGNVCPARSEWGLWGERWGRSGDGRQTSSVKTLPVLTRGGWCVPLPRGIGSHLCSICRTQAPEFPGWLSAYHQCSRFGLSL